LTESRIDLGVRRYPQTWLLLDVVDRAPRLLSQEVVDLSPGAIELRHVARDLRSLAENPERWLPLRASSPIETLAVEQARDLSFGLQVSLCVERDDSRAIHTGRPFRHLRLRHPTGTLTPATSAEVGLYFYGKRPATFGFVRADTAHGFIGLGWEQLEPADIQWLLDRELRES
jgi:hypothetical protein